MSGPPPAKIPAASAASRPARGLAFAAWGLACAVAAGAHAAGGAEGRSAAERVRETRTLRVCVWPDYYGISYRNPKTQQFSGLDIDLAGELASDLGVALRFVDSSFTTLADDLAQRRCDVAMFAVGQLPQRGEHMRFTRPYMESDIFAVTTRESRKVMRWEDIDLPGVRVAVQAGTFMEPVMRQALKRASLVVVRPPATREQELQSGRVDVFMTDYPYSRRLLDNVEWARLIGPPQPFHVLPYAYAVRLDEPDWLQQVDAFVERIQKDGRLAAAARRHGLSSVVRLPSAPVPGSATRVKP